MDFLKIMTCQSFLRSLIFISIFLFLAPLIVLLVIKIIKKFRPPEKDNKFGISKVLIFSICLFGAILFFRFATECAEIVGSDSSKGNVTFWEIFFNSIFGTLRTFSLEESFKEYSVEVKKLVENIIEVNAAHFMNIQLGMIVYSAILSFVAPVITGAIVLEMVASIFPKARLWISFRKIWRPKYFFSELNAESLALAKSIYYAEKKKPILIFTDTYVDDEKEKEYELLLEAKKYGAICLREDLAHVAKNRFGKRHYYLMDVNEFSNLQALTLLGEKHNVRFLKKAQIYIFVQSDAYVQVEEQFLKKLEHNKSFKVDDKPIIVPVRGYRNLVHNLFVDVPLYEPLIDKKDNSKLNVTILGNGIIGTEAFLGAYWMSQILVNSVSEEGKEIISECDVTINIVSKDAKEEFWSKIDYINPDIKDTIKIIGDDSDNSNSLLAWNDEGDLNSPYCKIRYIQADVKLDGFWDGHSDDARELINSDYFIVALGNDADNISVADKLRRLVGKKHLEETDDNISGNVVIAYAVFNAELVNTLNNEKLYQCRSFGKNDIYMHAFGSLEQVYSCDNVYMSKSKLLAKAVGDAYNKLHSNETHISENKKRATNQDKNYSYWADLARAMHIKYKVFSLGLIEKSVFDANSDELQKHINEKCELYKEVALAVKAEKNGNTPVLKSESYNLYNALEVKKHLLAWLEHRRWVAFTRTMGYQYTDEFKKNLALNGKSHKNMELKLHPCLVEARMPEIDGYNEYLYKPFEDNHLHDTLKLKEVVKSKFGEGIDEQKLSTEQMLILLNELKVFLNKRNTVIASFKTAKLDLLDKLTYEWCEEVTRVHILQIDEAIAYINNNKNNPSRAVRKEMHGKFKNAWGGIGCYDFKQYDYYTDDYDEPKEKKKSK